MCLRIHNPRYCIVHIVLFVLVQAIVTPSTRARLQGYRQERASFPGWEFDVHQAFHRRCDMKAGCVQWCLVHSSGYLSLYPASLITMNGQLLGTGPLHGSLGRLLLMCICIPNTP